MKVVIDERWSLEQTWADDIYHTPTITIRDEHSYSRTFSRENDEFMFNFLETILDTYENEEGRGEPVAWRVRTPYGDGYSFKSEEVMEDMSDWFRKE